LSFFFCQIKWGLFEDESNIEGRVNKDIQFLIILFEALNPFISENLQLELPHLMTH
jgi:hypothetical protein